MSEFQARQTVKREDLPADANLCEYCTGKCCRYYAFPITTPKTWRDFDYIRWYLIHGRAAIFVDAGTWYIMVYADCQHLQGDNSCAIYHTRPQVCRDYTTEECEYDIDSDYDKLFETAEQIEEYAEAVLPPKKRAPWTAERQRQMSLPMLPRS